MQILGYEVDPMSGERVTYGAQAGRFIVKRERDVGPALDYATALVIGVGLAAALFYGWSA